MSPQQCLCEIRDITKAFRCRAAAQDGKRVIHGGCCPRACPSTASQVLDTAKGRSSQCGWSYQARFSLPKMVEKILRRVLEAAGLEPPGTNCSHMAQVAKQCQTGPGHSAPCLQMPPMDRRPLHLQKAWKEKIQS